MWVVSFCDYSVRRYTMSLYVIEHECCQLLWAVIACASEESRISGGDVGKVTARF